MYYQCRVLNITELDDVLRYVYIDGFGDLVWVKVVETSLDLTQRQDVRVHISLFSSRSIIAYTIPCICIIIQSTNMYMYMYVTMLLLLLINALLKHML